MTITSPGYFPDTYYPDYYWQDEYWPDWGSKVIQEGLNDLARVINIKRSLDAYIYENISGVAVNYEGLPFNNTEEIEWIQPRVLQMDTDFHRQGSASEYAETVNIVFQVNSFVKKSGATKTDRHYLLADIVDDLFKVGNDIPLRISGTTNISGVSMRVRGIVNDAVILESNQYYEYGMAWNLNFTRLTED